MFCLDKLVTVPTFPLCQGSQRRRMTFSGELVGEQLSESLKGVLTGVLEEEIEIG